MMSPHDMDYNLVPLMREDPAQGIQFAMSEADYKFFRDAHVPIFKVQALEKAYAEYYDIKDPGPTSASPH
jgi:hypothetical protein